MRESNLIGSVFPRSLIGQLPFHRGNCSRFVPSKTKLILSREGSLSFRRIQVPMTKVYPSIIASVFFKRKGSFCSVVFLSLFERYSLSIESILSLLFITYLR